MKKLVGFLLILSLLVGMMTFAAFAEDELPRDITDEIKWITAYDMYMEKLPIVRDDSVFIYPTDYDAATVPGSGIREITFTDWEEADMEEYFDDYFSLGDGYFVYDAVWAKSVDVPYDHGLMTYTFEVAEAGTYELVFVGAAQIKEEDVNNDAKDRGFAFSVDGGERRQINISDTSGTFREYAYEYGGADLEDTKIQTANGVNSYYYQMTYYYGIQVELTAGEHTLEFYHLFYSGETLFESGNGTRLNFAGAYVQKWLSEDELKDYTYPSDETAEETTAEITEAPTETEAPTDPVTEAPTETEAPTSVETTVESVTVPCSESVESSGCGSVLGLSAAVVALAAALMLCRRKDEN